MALFDFLKRKKKPAQTLPSAKIKVGKKPETKVRPPEIKAEDKIKPAEPKIKKKISEKAHQILYSPHITEKATNFEKENKYIFKIRPKANKIEVKEAVESTYGVDVVNVRIINIPKRQRRLARQSGWKKGYKKAIVKVKEGQKIEILPR